MEDIAEAARKLLDTLNPLEAQILRQSFGIDSGRIENDTTIAKSLRIPVEFVNEYRVRALRKLRRPLHSNLLREFLTKERPTRHVEIVVPKAIQEVDKLTPELLERLRTRADDLQSLKPDIFEHLVAELLASRDFYNVRLVGKDQKTSADIFASKYIDDVGEHRYFVEVKRWKHRIGVEVIDRVYGAMLGEKKDHGWTAALVVSIVGPKKFMKYTVDDIHSMGIYLKNRDDLLVWLDEYEANENGLWVPGKPTPST